MLVIQIKGLERKKYYLVLVDSKKVEGRKRDFLFQNQKLKRLNKKIILEVESRKALIPQICQIWVLRTPVIGLFIEVSFYCLMFFHSFPCPRWTRNVLFVKTSVIYTVLVYYNQVCGRCQSFPHKLYCL